MELCRIPKKQDGNYESENLMVINLIFKNMQHLPSDIQVRLLKT
jgi:hypothetical protein